MSAPLTNVVLDTCSILNMINGNVFQVICDLPHKFCIGPIVYDECTEQPCPQLDEMIAGRKIELVDGNKISVNEFTNLLNRYNLGDGETECLAIGRELGRGVCTDDGRARSCCKNALGDGFVIGTIGLLKEAVDLGLIDCGDAYERFILMKASGGFLPKLDRDDFC